MAQDWTIDPDAARRRTPGGGCRHLDALDRQVARFPTAHRAWRWSQAHGGVWLRIPAGLLLVVAGCLGFLPVLGFWMLPLGLLLMAQDVPPLRRPLRVGIVAGRRGWRRVRRHWRPAPG